MTVNAPPKRHAPVAASKRGLVQRAALLTGGVAAGFAGSALAGFGLVSLLFPHSGLPGDGPSFGTAPVAEVSRALIPSPVVTAPERLLPVRASEAPTGVDTPAVEAIATVLATAPQAPAVHPFDRATRQVTRMVRGAPAETAPAGLAPADPGPGARALAEAPSTRPLATGTGAPAAAPAWTELYTDFGPRIALLEQAEAATGPAEARAEAFATLAAVDAETRAGAGLFAGAPAGAGVLAGAPAGAGVLAETAAAAAPEARPADPELPVEIGLAAATPAEPASAAPLVSPRPQPRPEIVAAAPRAAPAAAQAAARAAAPEAEIEVDTVISTAGAPRSGRIVAGGSADCGRTLARAMPSREGGATGSDFFAGLTNLSGSDRDAKVIAELARGNMPSFLRDLQPVSFRGRDGRGAEVEITICVTPDYLALGSEQDYVRVPLGLPAAARIAGAFDMTLPTPTMVDAIYAQAGVKLAPSPMTPGPQMQSTPYLLAHNATIEKQLGGRRGLIAGQKKDVVMASRMASNPGRVAIYGWHTSGNAPIQPVSTVHGENYADYSHGIRLVSKTAYLNGKAVSLDDLLASSRYAGLLNEGGPMPGPVIRIASN